MRIKKNHIYAVVTGDVVASRSLSTARRRVLHTAMREVSRGVKEAFETAIPVAPEIFRGDGWQMLLTEPSISLRAALYYRAALVSRMESHGFDVRAAIGIGRVQFVPEASISEGDGEAFQASGTALETMPRSATLRLSFPGDPREPALDVLVQLVDRLAARWSDRQARAVTGALQGWTQTRIAETCWKDPITQQAVAQHLDRASWGAIETALRYFETTVARRADPQAA